jgi:hypothetical protein
VPHGLGFILVVDVVAVVVVSVVVLESVVLVGEVVVVLPVSPEVSQQVLPVPGQTDSPRCGLQRPATRHAVAPDFRARQHVTNSRLPHVEWAAHRITVALQSRGSSRVDTAACTLWTAQRT